MNRRERRVNEVPLVHVVVVDHNGGELTLACLRSILASGLARRSAARRARRQRVAAPGHAIGRARVPGGARSLPAP